jgi:hypothetical protein
MAAMYLYRLTWLILTVGICVFPAPQVQAGLYNLSEPVTGPAASGDKVQAMSFPDFRNRLVELIQVGNVQVENPLRTHYLMRKDELEREHRRGTLTTEEAIDLSAYLIRLKQYDAAVDLLTPLARERTRDNFFVISNLITAHFLNGQLLLASGYLFQVEKSRPPAQGTINATQADWFGHVEPYFWKLIKLRRSEGRAAPQGQKPRPTLDNLFDVCFVGESGQYEPGKLAAAERVKLPKDALAIVEQLVLWYPDDTRLYWLLGELLNVQGDLAGANVVFAECRDNRRFDADELQQHHRLIKEALAQATPAAPVMPALPPSEPASSWFADHSNLVIGGAVVGLVIILLGFLQVRELRRRGLKSR